MSICHTYNTGFLETRVVKELLSIVSFISPCFLKHMFSETRVLKIILMTRVIKIYLGSSAAITARVIKDCVCCKRYLNKETKTRVVS